MDRRKECVTINLTKILTWLSILSVLCSAIWYLTSTHFQTYRDFYNINTKTQDNTKAVERIEQKVEQIAERVNKMDGKLDVLLNNKRLNENEKAFVMK